MHFVQERNIFFPSSFVVCSYFFFVWFSLSFRIYRKIFYFYFSSILLVFFLRILHAMIVFYSYILYGIKCNEREKYDIQKTTIEMTNWMALFVVSSFFSLSLSFFSSHLLRFLMFHYHHHSTLHSSFSFCLPMCAVIVVQLRTDAVALRTLWW